MSNKMYSDERILARIKKNQSLIDDPNASVEDLKRALKRSNSFHQYIFDKKDERIEFLKNDTEFSTLKKYAFKGFATNLSGHEMMGIFRSLNSIVKSISSDSDRESATRSLNRVTEIFECFKSISDEYRYSVSYDEFKKIITNYCPQSYLKIDESCKEIDNISLEVNKMAFFGTLFNLISNAIEFSDRSADCRIVISFDGTSFFISDNGCGIPDDRIPFLFSFGHSTRVGGNGFGLALCQEMINSVSSMSLSYEPDSEFNVLGGACFKIKVI